MGSISHFVFIFVLAARIKFIENITDKNVNRIKSISSDIFDRKINGCLTEGWGCFGLPKGCIQTKNCEKLWPLIKLLKFQEISHFL